MRILGLVLVLAGSVLALGVDVSIFIDLPSAIIVVGGSVGMMLMTFGRDWSMGFRVLRRPDAARHDLELGHATLLRLRSFVVVSGVVGSLIGALIVAANADDPAWIGPAMAILLLTQVYALVLAFGLVHPMAVSLGRRLDELGA